MTNPIQAYTHDLLKAEELVQEFPLPTGSSALDSIEKITTFINNKYDKKSEFWDKEYIQLRQERLNSNGTSKYRSELSASHIMTMNAYYDFHIKKLQEEKKLLTELIIEPKVKGQILLAKKSVKEIKYKIKKYDDAKHNYCIPT